MVLLAALHIALFPCSFESALSGSRFSLHIVNFSLWSQPQNHPGISAACPSCVLLDTLPSRSPAERHLWSGPECALRTNCESCNSLRVTPRPGSHWMQKRRASPVASDLRQLYRKSLKDEFSISKSNTALNKRSSCACCKRAEYYRDVSVGDMWGFFFLKVCVCDLFNMDFTVTLRLTAEKIGVQEFSPVLKMKRLEWQIRSYLCML